MNYIFVGGESWGQRRERKRREAAAMEAEIRRVSEPIVVLYRRGDGSEASVTCFEDSYADQLDRITARGYTVLNVIR
ncbi:hypothetical protein NQ152_00205 [Microbacterium sp. zg.B48]|uniref:hypothetical protein n=1 Tax=Microbacterium sp. zg.B48 TaxID=2969408 RepID=UPI00214AA323|nr:hypothetical protein [Microbacterium sp. zg.B48]MCR2761925.1 hypothetical protein [Microbacterium sp. zg.B48]